MENCLFDGKELCVFELKDNLGYYDNDLVISWKELAHDKKLLCPECGAKVRLAAGQIVEPYFAHYDKKECSYGNTIESEESRKAKRLLYLLLKESFPNHEIHARYKLLNGLYSTLYVIQPNGRDIAFEYRRQTLSVEQYKIRESYYKEQNIISIFVLANELDKDEKQLSWYQDLIHKSMNYALFLNVFKETLLFKKSFEYAINGSRRIEIFSKEYKIQELKMDQEGNFNCDFEEECNEFQKKLEDRIKKLERELREARERQLKEQRELREARIRQERELREAKEREAIRYQKYRESIRLKELEKQGSELQQRAMSLESKKQLPDWVRPDILKTAIQYMNNGEGHLVSDKYRQLIIELGLYNTR